MTHYAVLWMFGNYYTNYKPDANKLAFIVPIAVVLLIGFAYLAMKVYDIPLRNYLNIKRKEKLSKQKNSISIK